MRVITRHNRGVVLDLIELGLRATVMMDMESTIGTERHRALVIARRTGR